MIYDAAIIGAGPAGLTAGIYTSRAGLNTFITDDLSNISQAAYAGIIENFPGFDKGINGAEFISRSKTQVLSFGGDVVSQKVKEVRPIVVEGRHCFQVSCDNAEYTALAVIAASGAFARRLGVKGEAEFLGKGVSYCAVCDGAFFKDKAIAVAGGGDSAVEEALFLTRFAKKVVIIHRRDKLRAVKALQEKVFSNKKIEISWDSVVEEVIGSGTAKMSGLKIRNTKTQKTSHLECEGLFVSIGRIPNTDFLKNTVDLDTNGYIITGKGLSTTAKGVFACGDCRDTLLMQVVTACADGAVAAQSCLAYIDKIKGNGYA